MRSAHDGRYRGHQGSSPRAVGGVVGLSRPYDFLFETALLRNTFAGPRATRVPVARVPLEQL